MTLIYVDIFDYVAHKTVFETSIEELLIFHL